MRTPRSVSGGVPRNRRHWNCAVIRRILIEENETLHMDFFQNQSSLRGCKKHPGNTTERKFLGDQARRVGTTWMCAVNSIRSLYSEQGFSQAGINHPTGENKRKSCQHICQDSHSGKKRSEQMQTEENKS
ncbi:hypothetical protein AV530_004355 [Patagioenas fasciata monilis]|uniref:Uncharacterized protein n=1 Tax=Patagioenas fasciata monilis TaxID=372326 RepID=A0A1V4KAS8_PATFA|nr:hypothetical protein AV530_004355 [Patagioenas fasciata monilis]